jgi:hypothetical protein
MELNRRFTLLPFPQFFDGATLSLNIVVLPRNQNPLIAPTQTTPPIAAAPPFAEAQLSFAVKLVSGLQSFPHSLLFNESRPLLTVAPANAQDLFIALGKNFDISNVTDKAEVAVPEERSVKKYLPFSYRQAFNFTTPRTRNAVTDDSYHCAVRGAQKVPGFQRSPDAISWGKVFAFALRQPLLAKQLGMIYETQLEIEVDDFPHGGWLFVDLADDSNYKTQQLADPAYLKRYAARIPPLKPSQPRPVFAPLLFPVLHKAALADPDPAPDGNYDLLFIEAASYDDGFARIVHARQPHSRNLLAEESDGAHPVKDAGVRLGWDDEQILIWYMRQLMIDPTVSAAAPDKRLDAPLGVFGYTVDVREIANPENAWESLNLVTSRNALSIPADKNQPEQVIPIGDFNGELPYQVYPVQLDGNKNNSYWLPMYFANWNGHSLVLPDSEAAQIYQTTHPDVKPDPEDTVKDTGTGVTGPAQNQLSQLYAAGALNTMLRYGRHYEFRVRLRDLSGGGAPLLPEVKPINETPSNRGRCRFKRYVAPNRPCVADLPVNTDEVTTLKQLRLQRPLLGYPAVVYTDKYADAVGRLTTASQAMQGKEAFGIADPDVDRVEITVEVQTLKLDNLLSVSGKDNYVHLYTTTRSFPAVNNEDDYEATLEIPLVYRDCKVLRTGADANLVDDLQLPADIDDLPEIVLPTARTIRLTLRALCEEKAENKDYYGLLNDKNPALDVRYGQSIELMSYQPSTDETELFVEDTFAQMLQGIFLQPEPARSFDGKLTTFLLGKEIEKAPELIQRLAKQLKIENTGLTLTGAKGERLQFGCAHRIRHTLAPDNSSLTISSKGDLTGHWLCCLTLQLNRDWMWDALEERSFIIKRTVRFTDDKAAEAEIAEIGEIELRHTAPFEALANAQRDHTRLIFIDAVEPKNHRTRPAPNQTELRFPDTIEVSYSIEPRFKAGHATQADQVLEVELTLPITTPPAQVPQIAAAGIALSPYQRNEKYSATEPRQRYLWIEFAEPVKDRQDAYFARVLAYAPDQLISNNHPELFEAPEEPALPIDPEYIRVIAPGASNDLAGLNAMQLMQKATDSDRHYLLPLPPGLHADAAELFGFFTYEIRVGHYYDHVRREKVWSTAQGRFGRPLRVTGIQHPAPTLTCSVNRDEEKLYVTAPYAAAVFNGKDVTAAPPRTQLWCLLYAQVRQADNLDNRNILLDDKPLDWRVQIEQEKQVNWLTRYDAQQIKTLKHITINNWKDELSYGQFQHVFKLAETETSNHDATKYGTVVWSNHEVAQLLALYGLPEHASLSVLVVETLPTITNIYEHLSGLENRAVVNQFRNNLKLDLPEQGIIKELAARVSDERTFQASPSPVSDTLGHQRILRTSPLTEVTFFCCTDC